MKKGLFFSLSFIGKVGFATALPLVGFAFLGRYLDRIYASGYLFFLIGIALAAAISILMLRSITKDAIKKIQKLD